MAYQSTNPYTGKVEKTFADISPAQLEEKLKRAHPDLPVCLNGGIKTLEAAKPHLEDVDGVMLGRAAYQNPELLLRVDSEIFDQEAPHPDVFAAVEAYLPYVEESLSRGARLADLTRHMLGLFAGRPGARAYRQTLATLAPRPSAGLAVLRRAIACVSREPLAALGESSSAAA